MIGTGHEDRARHYVLVQVYLPQDLSRRTLKIYCEILETSYRAGSGCGCPGGDG